MMDDMRLIEPEPAPGAADDMRADPMPSIGGDERRMHVRAYNFWVSLLGSRTYPAIGALDPAVADFGDHSVLLDFSAGIDCPTIVYLGEALRRECDLSPGVCAVADVPSRSLLSRLTDQYLHILANRAPIGFEAEFVSRRNTNMLYRGILMPFSSDDRTIDFVYGVINWKECATGELAVHLEREVERAIGPAATATCWADGPGALFAAANRICAEPIACQPDAAGGCELIDRLALARTLADQAEAARLESRSILYRALGLAYDLALAGKEHGNDLAGLLAEAGIGPEPRTPMTAIVKLVFGSDIDPGRLAEFAGALAQAHRIGVPAGRFPAYAEAERGGLKALVRDDRLACRREAGERPAEAALRQAVPVTHVAMASDDAEFVLVLARRAENGRLALLAPVPDEPTLIAEAIRRIVG